MKETLTKYYVLNVEAGVLVKTAEMFEAQGLLEKPWGRQWVSVMAFDVEHAIAIAMKMRSDK